MVTITDSRTRKLYGLGKEKRSNKCIVHATSLDLSVPPPQNLERYENPGYKERYLLQGAQHPSCKN
eukprot:c6285_g1_i1 orf=163-360(-)